MKVKICGLTHPEDASYAAHLGADYIGLIFASPSKRRVSIPEAKKIAQAARQAGAQPVGVFLDATADEILSTCKETGLLIVQLGGASRQHLPLLQKHFSLLYAAHVG